MSVKSNLPKGKPVRYTVPKICEAFKDTTGTIAEASRKLGCNRRTVERALDKYEKVRKAKEDAEQDIRDLTVNKIVGAIQKGDMITARWYAERKIPEFKPKQDINTNITGAEFSFTEYEEKNEEKNE